MKKITSLLLISVLAFSSTACTQTEQSVAKWGAGGAAVGALGGAVLGRGGGAVLAGAAIGAVAGSAIGYTRTKKGVRYCQYRDRNGRYFEARCR